MRHEEHNISKIVSHGILLLAAIALTIVLSEIVLRLTIVRTDSMRRRITDEIMTYLREDDRTGFIWKERMNHRFREKWFDHDELPLVTDNHGFLNDQESIRHLESGGKIEVLGIGDSFLHDATFVLTQAFGDRGIDYYNLAMHRYCPPQYNLVLNEYAPKLRPRFLVYQVYENDFEETDDFETWRASGSSWFTYHSGTWFGAPITDTASRPQSDTFLVTVFEGISSLFRKIGYRMTVSRESPETDNARCGKIIDYIDEAVRACNDNRITCIVMLVPSKEFIASKDTKTHRFYGPISAYLNERHIPVIDLRHAYLQSDDPLRYYYKIDGHWNRDGILRAFDELIAYIDKVQDR